MSEIKSLMSSIKSQVEELENKLAEYEQCVDVEEVMDIELEPSDDLPFYDDLPVSDSETEVDDLPDEVVPEPEVEVEPETVPEPEPVVEPAATETPVPVIDAMTARQQWRKDMPGSPVRDIRSAISLNDRILFINYLFGEDPMAFQEMLTQLNAMPSFDEAASLAIASHPEWDLESDTVYRFMMALRRRHQ
ncbi:MAG: hypothetical protein J6Q12_06890 [Bacteroidales bacterium]|nr:hypothetical protein [Bacteroidales bacterium]